MIVYILKMLQTQNCIWYHSCSDSYSILGCAFPWQMKLSWLFYGFEEFVQCHFFFHFRSLFLLLLFDNLWTILFNCFCFFFFCYYWNALWITFHFHIYIIENCYSWYCLYIHVYILITNWQRTVFIFCQIDNAQTSSSKLLKQSFIDHFLNFSNATDVQDTHVF